MPEMHGKQVFTYSTYHKAFDIAKNPKYDGCQCGIVWWFINFLIKKVSSSGVKSEIVANLKNHTNQLLQNSKKKKKVYSSFKYNFWCSDIAHMLISDLNVAEIFRRFYKKELQKTN